VLSDELFRAEVDARLQATGLKLLDNVYADHVTLALHARHRAEGVRRARRLAKQ
jgi:hypothetical protein